jgi:SAM-dependent methyltransferase
MRVIERFQAIVQATAKTLGYEIHKIGKVSFGRASIADVYITGSGIEVGALDGPLQVPPTAKVKYVDRFPVSELRKQYPELDPARFVDVDIVDDGELLRTIGDTSQDFVIANHLLEHCQDPIGALGNMLRVLKPNGILYMAVPDKRFTFDVDRPVTHIHHLLQDFKDGGVSSRRAAFEEWVRCVAKVQGDTEVETQVDKLMRDDYSIHYHAWTQLEIMELVLTLRREMHLQFEIELVHKSGVEVILVLRKTG